MWRRYIPNTNWPSDAITRTNHSPSAGKLTGSDARTPPLFERILTKRTTSGDDDSVPKGFSVSSRIRSRPSHSTTFASNGSLRSNALRNFVRDPGLRTTNVPAAPTFMTSKPPSSRATMLGRKVLFPPTLTPRRKTTSAIPWIMQKKATVRYGFRLGQGSVHSHAELLIDLSQFGPHACRCVPHHEAPEAPG
jgi:hypothetical protein